MFFKPWVYVIALVIIIALIAVIQPDSNEPVSYTHLTLPTKA